MSSPSLSIVVIVHRMKREIERTLHGLSPDYQTGVSEDRYEVIVVENGVQELTPEWVAGFGQNFRYHFHATQSISPAAAVNVGVRSARAENVAIIVDGARVPTPGLIARTLVPMRGMGSCFVGALAWQLGPDVQWRAMMNGYDQAVEDGLLDDIDWPADCYRLFEIATIAPSSDRGLLGGLPTELSWLALPVTAFERLGGFDESFQSAGGGLVCHDFLRRLCELDELTPVMLLGEGTFHQIHGGAMTGRTGDDRARVWKEFRDEYARLRGREYVHEKLPDCMYFGSVPKHAEQFLAWRLEASKEAAEKKAAQSHRKSSAVKAT